ncbi:MAG: bifunctional glucose-6-phosphate/mannose-6-phosphate isomerase [Frankiales bacterium]|nr:bifunctional glucose-6-phosphate/mannose-6-phosphate isomerase [Frankiales bacterium]
MSAFESQLLDDPDALLRADRGGLLRALAGSGAQIRRAQAAVDEVGFSRLRSDVAPRAVLVAVDAHAPYLSSLIASLGGDRAPVIDWRSPLLPRWAGPADALLVATADGLHPRLAELVQQADQRGLSIAVAAPADSPVAAAAARHPMADLSAFDGIPPRAVWWALATPLLMAAHELELLDLGEELPIMADALDVVAEANRPDSSSFTGPAKLLAADLAEAVPVIAGAGEIGTVAARRVAGAVQLIAGYTAMAAALPDDIARIGALLEFGVPAERDLFADRVEDVAQAPRLVLVGDDDPDYVDYDAAQSDRVQALGSEAGRRAASALIDLARSRGIGVSRIDVPRSSSLVRFAAAAAVGDFAAAYLALARGVDPSAPRLGELPH